MEKRLKVKNDQEYCVKFDENMQVVNDQEFIRLHNMFKRKFGAFVHNKIVARGIVVAGMSVEDFIQELNIVLVNCIYKYDESRGCFNTLVWNSCANRIADILKKELHTREYIKHRNTDKSWIANQIVGLQNTISLQQYDALYENNNNTRKATPENHVMDYSKYKGLIDPRGDVQHAYDKIANIILGELL